MRRVDYLKSVTLIPADRKHSYNIRVRADFLAEAGPLIAAEVPAPRYLIVTDSQVGRLYAARLRETLRKETSEVGVIEFAAGEWNKTRESWGELSDGLARAGLGSDTAVVALGGGVTCDLAGFLASTHAHGVPLILVPTSSLAMLDAPLGGWVSLHTPAGRNLVGVRHLPSLVLVDPLLLKTQPRPQYLAGLAVALKHGLVHDAGYLEATRARLGQLLDREAEALAELIARSLEIKAEILDLDQREDGYRAVLELGERTARVQQAILGFSWLDGETLAVGLALEAALGEAVGVTSSGVSEYVCELLQEVGLPTELDGEIDSRRFFENAARLAGLEGSGYTLLSDVGRVAGSSEVGWAHDIPDETVRSVIFGRPRAGV